MTDINYGDFITFGEHELTCTSPTPEREVYFTVTFGRRSVLPKIKNHIKAAKTAVAKKLISPTFGAIQVHALETLMINANYN